MDRLFTFILAVAAFGGGYACCHRCDCELNAYTAQMRREIAEMLAPPPLPTAPPAADLTNQL